MIYRVVTHLQQEAVQVSHACRLLQVSRSGYYAHRSATPSARKLQEQTHIKAAFAASGASYGSRRVMHALREQGLRIGRYRVQQDRPPTEVLNERLRKHEALVGLHREIDQSQYRRTIVGHGKRTQV